MIQGECIEHNQKQDYGCTTFEGRTGVRLHRVAYCKHHSVSLKSIDGLFVRHMCNNPRCINPEHLLTGSHRDNMKDMVVSGRSLRGTRSHTAKLDEEKAELIRQDYKSGMMSQRALASKYGVSQSTINATVRGTRW